ncbi:MAG: XdhC family protein [Bacteroidales bacterium]|jgi:xanthine dehydrogenase accessory factor|nr:XdhC family protein [Bacteroidales bacterium]
MELWNFIISELSKNKKVILIIVVEVNGSSPGKVGFKMAVSESGVLNGSIGGGVMEFNMVELARKELKKENIKSFIKRQIHNPDAGTEKSGLICSGEQIHAFIPFDKSSIHTIQQLIDCFANGNKGVLTLTNAQFTFEVDKTQDKPINYQYTNENNWFYSEQMGLLNTLYIFGGGHVSVPLSQVANMLDFRVEIFDNRKDLSTIQANHFAHKKTIVDYSDIAHLVSEGMNSYAVIMTAGHKADQLILKQLVTKNLKYLGMIGSKNKTKTIFENLLNEGIKQLDLDKVDAPIGLSINSETPAEIAISIAAKMVQVKNSL